MKQFITNNIGLAQAFLIVILLVVARYSVGLALFHTLVEFMTIFVGVMMFMVVNNTRHLAQKKTCYYT